MAKDIKDIDKSIGKAFSLVHDKLNQSRKGIFNIEKEIKKVSDNNKESSIESKKDILKAISSIPAPEGIKKELREIIKAIPSKVSTETIEENLGAILSELKGIEPTNVTKIEELLLGVKNSIDSLMLDVVIPEFPDFEQALKKYVEKGRIKVEVDRAGGGGGLTSAQEIVLANIEGNTDGIETKLDTLNAKDFSTESSLLNAISELQSIKSNQTNNTQSTKLYANSNEVDTQHPLPVNGDSVYSKDVDVAGSSIGTFTGNVTDLFDSLSSTITSTGHSSPATFTIKLNRPINNDSIKFCSPPGKNFSNVKIILKDASGSVVRSMDFSSDNTKYTSNEYYWRMAAWCTITVEFYTTDDIDLSWAILEKAILIHGPVKHRSIRNSSTTPLAGGATFTGEWVSTKNYAGAIVVINTDQNSATNGFIVEHSNDSSTVLHQSKETILANSPEGHRYPISLPADYFRVKYTNGAVAQSSFSISSTLFPVMPENGHSHAVEHTITGDEPATVVRSILTGKNPAGNYVNVQTTTAGNTKVSLEEMETAVAEMLNLYPVGAGTNGSATLTLANTAYAVPTGTAPAFSYRLNVYNGSDSTIFVGYQNTNSNGIALYPGESIEDELGASQALYAYCASAGKVLTYSYKRIN